MTSQHASWANHAGTLFPSARMLACATLAAVALGCATVAQAAPDVPACGPAGCGTGRIDAAVVKDAVREAARDASGRRHGADAPRLQLAAPTNPASVWDRRIGGPAGREEYNCALSFGVGGTLGGDRFLATRLLGRTSVWRDQQN